MSTDTRPITYMTDNLQMRTDELGMTTPMTDDLEVTDGSKTIDEFKQTSILNEYGDMLPSLLAMVKATDARSRSFVADWQSERKDDPKTLIIQGGRGPAAFVQNFRTVRFGMGQRMGHTTLGIRLCEEWAPNFSLLLTNEGWPAVHPHNLTLGSMWSGGTPSLSGAVSTHLERQLNTFKLIVIDNASEVPKEQLDALMGFLRPTVGDLGPMYVLLQ